MHFMAYRRLPAISDHNRIIKRAVLNHRQAEYQSRAAIRRISNQLIGFLCHMRQKGPLQHKVLGRIAG